MGTTDNPESRSAAVSAPSDGKLSKAALAVEKDYHNPEAPRTTAEVQQVDMFSFDVDVVYTWFNPDASTLDLVKEICFKEDSKFNIQRYRNFDQLQPSIYSIYKFLPWVRRIHVVSSSKRPCWIDRAVKDM